VSIHILKLEILGREKSTPLNGISSRDSKKEGTRRRETNKIICADGHPFLSIGVEPSIFFFNGCWGLHQSELGGIKSSIRCERK
jgi:hypothetical protein